MPSLRDDAVIRYALRMLLHQVKTCTVQEHWIEGNPITRAEVEKLIAEQGGG